MEYLTDVMQGLTHDESRFLLKKFYTGAYALGKYRSSGAIYVWEKILVDKISFSKAIDIGCGMGWGMRICNEIGKTSYGVDLAQTIGKDWEEMGVKDRCLCADVLHLPFKADMFDLVVCNDVLEHIPEFDIDAALTEIRRIGSDKFVLVPCLSQEAHPVLGEIYAHLTVKPASWWKDKFESNGFTIAGEVSNFGEVDHYFVYAVKHRKPYTKKEGSWPRLS